MPGEDAATHYIDAMAAAGAGYREILTHYYTGVTVEPYQG